jgi:hypothetical protein
MDSLEDKYINLKVKRLLKEKADKMSSVLLRSTLISKDIYYGMFNGKLEKGILTGKKYYDKNTNIKFDVLYKMEEMSKINKNFHEAPIVPHYSYLDLENPQEYFLSLNEKYPQITKFFLSLKKNTPSLFRLINQKSNENKKVFVPGTYFIFDKEKE